MAKNALRKLIDTLFPSGDRTGDAGALIERGLEALRRERDERAITMGKQRMVPSRLELSLSQPLYDELAELAGVRDVEYFLNDELMKDLRLDRIKTFSDLPVHVTLAVDTSLAANEIRASVLAPESELRPDPTMPSGGTPYDRTAVLGQDDALLARANQPQANSQPSYRLVLRQNGIAIGSASLSGRHWIVGRRGVSGRALPEGCVKVDLDLPPTVSREQLRIDLIDAERMRLQCIGQGGTSLGDGDRLALDENRLIAVGVPIFVEEYELVITRSQG
jgi:hypothetical protein